MNWAWAHPLGPDGWSAYTAVQIGQTEPEVVVVLEVPMQEALERFQAFSGDRMDAKAEIGFRASMWSQLSQGLAVRLNGKPVVGSWEPVWTPVNGHLAEGFFVYLVRFKPERSWALPDRWMLEVDNQAFLEASTWLSAWVDVQPPWGKVRHSASQVLKRLDPEPSSSADVWSQDARLRTLVIEAQRADKLSP